MDPRDLDLCVTGCAGAHQRLLAELDSRVENATLDTEAASLLPNWTVGHVLGHVVGNARAFIRVVDAASRGDIGQIGLRFEQRGDQLVDLCNGSQPLLGVLLADGRSLRLDATSLDPDNGAGTVTNLSLGAKDQITELVPPLS
jgi:hypothetical protein